MDPSASFVLPEDVLVFPAAELASDLHAQAAPGPDDYVVTRPNARQGSTVIDKNGALLIERFRRARTIVDAIIDFSRDRGLDPKAVLEESFPFLQAMVAANLLVPHTSLHARPILPTLRTDDKCAGWTVEQAVHVVVDTEVYRMRDDTGHTAALKIARPGHEDALRQTFRREAAVLSQVAGTAAPRLIASGEHADRPYLLLQWCEGAPALAHGRRLQRDLGRAAAPRLLRLCLAVLRAYAGVHARGVVQGDVHANNVLATENDDIHIIDFGRARVVADPGPLGFPPRAGAAFYYDPQWAEAMLAGRAPPPADPLSEQYCIAVHLRELLAGRPYLDFSLEPERMWRQIVEDPPVPFIRHGAMPWPDVEKAIGRALAKNPAERFASLTEFADALARAGEPHAEALAVRRTAPALLSEVLARVATNGAAYQALGDANALCSVNGGAAGIAYALYRIASNREDPATLALAELWINRAERQADNAAAFYDEEFKLSPAALGRTSLFHAPAGLSCVEALIALALGDQSRLAPAVGRFVTRSRVSTDNLDLTLGKSSTLLGCAALLPALPTGAVEQRAAITALGDDLAAELRAALAALPPIGAGASLNLGIAHGWGGVLFALLRWREVSRRGGPDPTVEIYLRDLAAQAEAAGEGLRWRWMTPQRPGVTQFMAGWCNGSAGLVHLWTLAERAFGGEDYGELARRAALHACTEAMAIGDLCCGASGQSYAMLNLYRHGGDAIWLQRARDLAGQAATLIVQWPTRRDSLYKGEVGVALLIADLERPELSCMPLFDGEP